MWWSQIETCETEFEKALSINPKHLDVFLKQSEIALKEGNMERLNQLKASIEPLDSYASEELGKKIAALKLNKPN